ncbi:M61 family metallopeptidase [Catalinimonas niigatensis]|uniref:M61 family metallopeptidase n=1 Tax=Catalinimonas niigatensis TaxID=1397264 RepID=UPI0026666CBC|nr:M61 family peptidase [Catalinimonas niigatensis]WPP49512.1 M61 family peptidase [Catalinimonas niigatensis]
MIHYSISYTFPNRQLIDFELKFTPQQEITFLQLPAWRPGRYELGNFAKNIQRFQIYDEKGKTLPFHKVSKDRWQVNTRNVSSLIVKYNYYAAEMTAGTTWLDDEQIYINFVNCIIYPEDRQQEKYRVQLRLPDDYQIACGLEETEKFTLEAPSFYHLAESPMVASSRLTHWQYEVAGHRFHLWFKGHVWLDKEATLSDFKRFTQAQIEMMGDFPCQDYHFIYQFLPYKAYHGVEHFNSTIIILGTAEEIRQGSKLYREFIGVSSHELFHTWNIIRIRPAEMMPYDYARENYFTTGYMAEGATTYYGDLFLARGGAISKLEYFEELNKVFKRHFENFGRFYYSLAASSYDLWLDGYVPGIPNRKVSIYVKGAIVSLMLDLTLRKHTQNQHSLDTLMQELWINFGKEQRGYSPQDIVELASRLAGKPLDAFFHYFIEGIIPVEEELNALLRTVGCQLKVRDSGSLSERWFGFRALQREGKLVVGTIEPNSPADRVFSKEDEIIAINGQKCNESPDELLDDGHRAEVTLVRRQKLMSVTLEQDGKTYFKQYTIVQRDDASEPEKKNFEQWLHCKW